MRRERVAFVPRPANAVGKKTKKREKLEGMKKKEKRRKPLFSPFTVGDRKEEFDRHFGAVWTKWKNRVRAVQSAQQRFEVKLISANY